MLAISSRAWHFPDAQVVRKETGDHQTRWCLVSKGHNNGFVHLICSEKKSSTVSSSLYSRFLLAVSTRQFCLLFHAFPIPSGSLRRTPDVVSLAPHLSSSCTLLHSDIYVAAAGSFALPSPSASTESEKE